MCGIFGAPQITPSVARMLPALAIAMEERGDDAWGASNGEATIRHLGAITETWPIQAIQIGGWEKGIFHTRKASTGDKNDILNAHPFVYPKADGTQIIGIHNGCLMNHQALNQTYNRNFTCDSMHIWKHRADGESWIDLDGWGVLAWYEMVGSGRASRQQMNLTRFNSTALKVVKLAGGEFLFASEILPLYRTAAVYGNPVTGTYEVEEFYQYFFEEKADGTMGFYKGDKLPFVSTATGTSTHTTGSGGWNGHYQNWPSQRYPSYSSSDGLTWCLCCSTTKVKEGEELVCGKCMSGFITDFQTYCQGQDLEGEEDAGEAALVQVEVVQ